MEGEILGPSMSHGHRLRDPAFAAGLRGGPRRRTRVAIVGGGPSGLAAARHLKQEGITDFLLLELEPEVGGTAIGGRSRVTRYPWGAHYLPAPSRENTALLSLLSEMGALTGYDPEGAPIFSEALLVREPEERLFYKGFWYPGLYLRVGATEADRAELARFQSLVDGWVSKRDGRGRRAFTLPVRRASDDAELVALDRMSAKEWLDRQGLRSPRLLWLLEYGCRDDYGLDLAHTSAWALLFYNAARMDTPGHESADILTWPEGNAALVDHLALCAKDRVQAGVLVAEVADGEREVEVTCLDTKTQSPFTVLADRCIVAAPQMVAAHLVRGRRESLGDALTHFSYGAWMVANLHLTGRPSERGHPPAWDNVLYESPALGYVSATHQRGRDAGPTVWSYYLPFTDADPRRGRARLLEPTWDEWRTTILGDLSRAHPDLRAHVARLDVWRWGHGMIQPRPGFVFGGAKKRAAASQGRISFAHSDLSGLALFEEAFDQGIRAAEEVVAALRPAPSEATPEGAPP